jgi:hypothetical protein
VYVFHRNAQGEWSQTQRLVPSDAQPGDGFGAGVAIHDDRIAASAPGAGPGKAFVYEFSAAGYQLAYELSTPTDQETGTCCLPVELAGETLAVAEPENDAVAPDAGAIHVFEETASAWTLAETIVPQDAASQARLGGDLSLDGDRIAATRVDTTYEDGPVGQVVVHEAVETGGFERSAVLVGSNVTAGETVSSVDLDEERLLTGVPDDDTEAGRNAGAAYVFENKATGWDQIGRLRTPDGAGGDRFGHEVAIDGQSALVTADRDNTVLGGSNAGSAYVFSPVTSDAGVMHSKLVNPQGDSGDRLGSDVALDGQTAIVSARLDDTSAGADAGSAQIYHGLPTWVDRPEASWLPEAPSP